MYWVKSVLNQKRIVYFHFHFLIYNSIGFSLQILMMLWSQIKMTSFNFSYLHITGEFDNRPGTRRFLRIFSCVVTYRTGAGWRLYMETSADVRPGTVLHPMVPGRTSADVSIVRDQPNTVRCTVLPGRTFLP